MKEIKITIQKNGQVQITGDYLNLDELCSTAGLLEIEAIDRYIAEEIRNRNEEINNTTLKKHFMEGITKIQFAVLEYIKNGYGPAKRSVENGESYGKNN